MTQKKTTKKKTEKEKKQETSVTVAVGQMRATAPSQTTPEVIQNIELSMIVCNPFNPRKYRTEEDLQELTQSIVNFGIIQPITVRRKEDKYEIVCGERRYRASVKAKLLTIPVIVKEYSDEEAMEICILENLQRRDINPVEEAVSFGKLMEVRKYSIDDLVKQFGKTDKYIRSRLQLRNLTDDVANLLINEEITLAIALELARSCHDIQKDVYKKHLSNDKDDTYSWKGLSAKEFQKRIENGYSADLSQYEFDKSDCKICASNSSQFDLFADGQGGHCQNLPCLQFKQGEYLAYEATKMLNQAPNIGICVAPGSFASEEVVDNLMDTGCEIYEIAGTPMPVEPSKPLPQEFESEEEYKHAESTYTTSLESYRLESAQIQTMVAEGTAQLMVNVSSRKPELCYRVVSEAENLSQKEEVDTVEKLRKQDARNKEIAFEKGIEDTRRLVREGAFPNTELQEFEANMLFYCLLTFLRKDNYAAFGFDTEVLPTDEQKIAAIVSLTDEQKNIIQRDFIIKHLSDTSGNRRQSHLLLEFATLHFADKVQKIKDTHIESYYKKNTRIEERIRQIQPIVDAKAIESIAMQAKPVVAKQVVKVDIDSFDKDIEMNNVPSFDELLNYVTVENVSEEDFMGTFPEVIDTDYEEVTEAETFHESGMDNVPFCPELPQRVHIGEIPEIDEHLETINEAELVSEIAA
jgi:ParB family chromosome partitioning protein